MINLRICRLLCALFLFVSFASYAADETDPAPEDAEVRQEKIAAIDELVTDLQG